MRKWWTNHDHDNPSDFKASLKSSEQPVFCLLILPLCLQANRLRVICRRSNASTQVMQHQHLRVILDVVSAMVSDLQGATTCQPSVLLGAPKLRTSRGFGRRRPEDPQELQIQTQIMIHQWSLLKCWDEMSVILTFNIISAEQSSTHQTSSEDLW